jgi:hypothetical protein
MDVIFVKGNLMLFFGENRLVRGFCQQSGDICRVIIDSEINCARQLTGRAQFSGQQTAT